VVACGEIDLADRSRNVMFIAEWPKAWMSYYIRSGFVGRDPVLNALKVYRRRFRSSTSSMTEDSRAWTARLCARLPKMGGIGASQSPSRGAERALGS